MLTCQELTEVVNEYLEGRMSFWRRAEFHLHLGICRHCRAYLHQTRTTIRTVGALPSHEQMPPEVQSALLERLRSMRPQQRD